MTRSVQPSNGATRPSVVAGRLERAHHRRADGDHPAAEPWVVVDPLGGAARAPDALGIRQLVDSSDATPVCSTSGATPTPLATSRVITSGVNGRPALGISALPGSVA